MLNQFFSKEIATLSKDIIKEAAKKKRESQKEKFQRENIAAGGLLAAGAAPIGQRAAHMAASGLDSIVSPSTPSFINSTASQFQDASPELYDQFIRSGGAIGTPAGVVGIPVAHQGSWENFPGKGYHKYVHVPKGDSAATMAHELGHGTGLLDNKAYRKGLNKVIDFSAKTKKARNYGAMGGLALASGAAFNPDLTDEENERNMRYSRNLSLASALPQLGLLAEEARATGRAVRYAPKGRRLKYMAQLAPAYGTYLAHGLGVPAITAGAAEYGRRKFKKRKEAKRGK